MGWTVPPGVPQELVAPGSSPAHATTASPDPASARKPLNQVQVFPLLAAQVPSHGVPMPMKVRGLVHETGPHRTALSGAARSEIALSVY